MTSVSVATWKIARGAGVQPTHVRWIAKASSQFSCQIDRSSGGVCDARLSSPTSPSLTVPAVPGRVWRAARLAGTQLLITWQACLEPYKVISLLTSIWIYARFKRCVSFTFFPSHLSCRWWVADRCAKQWANSVYELSISVSLSPTQGPCDGQLASELDLQFEVELRWSE